MSLTLVSVIFITFDTTRQGCRAVDTISLTRDVNAVDSWIVFEKLALLAPQLDRLGT